MGPGGGFNLDAPFVYPLTTAMFAAPFSLLSPLLGATVFVGIAASLLAWGITQDGYGRLPIFGSAPFIWAAHSGQLSPLITASALIPALGWLAPVKPNIGLAALAYKPKQMGLDWKYSVCRRQSFHKSALAARVVDHDSQRL